MFTFAEVSRLVLAVVWGVAGVSLISADLRSHSRHPLRLTGGLVALGWAVFNLAISSAVYMNWCTSWHNETGRLLSYLTATVFLVWGLLSSPRGEDEI